jgi:hypothetical protein
MTEKATRYIPRWLHFKANVTSDLTGFQFTEIPPNAFANEGIWPYHLEYLTISGFPPGPPTGGVLPGYFWGGVGNCVNIELGISGVSDINQVTATATTIMGHGPRAVLCPPYSPISNGGAPPYYDDVFIQKLKYPYLLNRGNGLNVEFRSARDDWQYDALNQPYQGLPAFAAHGRSLKGNHPVMIAGNYRTTDDPNVFPAINGGGGISFNKADLVNDGKDDVLLDTLCFSCPLINVACIDNSGHGPLIGAYSEYLVNPINGPKWMPGSNPIPLMGLCPGSLPWPMQFGVQPIVHTPAVYQFPESTVLNRRQRLSVRMFNNAMYPAAQVVSMPVRVDVTLFGYLEVN